METPITQAKYMLTLCRIPPIIKISLIEQYVAIKLRNFYFTINIGFERRKHNPQGITTSMQLYFSGDSLRNTAKSLEILVVYVTIQTIYNWIKKYTK